MNRVPESFIKKIVAANCKNDKRIIEAFKQVPRSYFVDDALARFAYTDDALPIGFGQTISKPSTVAFMTYLLSPLSNEKILEIGTGSGFQAAILSKLAESVFTVERIPKLYARASGKIRKMFIKNVFFKLSMDEYGWPDEAPFDKIVFTCGADFIPDEYFGQLKNGGMLVAPVKGKITLYIKEGKNINCREYNNCNFVEYVTS